MAVAVAWSIGHSQLLANCCVPRQIRETQVLVPGSVVYSIGSRVGISRCLHESSGIRVRTYTGRGIDTARAAGFRSFAGDGRLRCHRLGSSTDLPPQNYGTWCPGGVRPTPPELRNMVPGISGIKAGIG